MGICQGDPIEMQDIMPEDLQRLRSAVTTLLQPMVGEPATGLPEGFPLYAQSDPLSNMARSIMFGMGNQPYQPQPDWGTWNPEWGVGPGPVGPGPEPGPVGPVRVGPGLEPEPGPVGPGPAGPVGPSPRPLIKPRPTPALKPAPGPEPGPVAIRPTVGDVRPRRR